MHQVDDVYGQDERQLRLFNLAGFNDKAEIVRVLIKHGADVTAQDENHSAPLHQVSSKGCSETLKLLIQHGADVNAHDAGRSTPLHLAASSYFALDGIIKIVDLPLTYGAYIDEKDDRGRTPYQIATSRGLSKIAELLSGHHVREE